MTPLVRELASYAQYAVSSGRVAASVRTVAQAWRRRRSLTPRRLALPRPSPARPIDTCSIGLAPFTSERSDVAAGLLQWDVRDSDPEAFWRVHRFGWMLERLVASLTLRVAHECVDAIRDWTRHPISRDPRVLDSYSVSERLANWSLLACLLAEAGDRTLLDAEDVRASVDAQASRLVESLEDYGAGYTNNHYLNNLRALFWYGTVWNAPDHRRAATHLAADALPRLFTPSGFLRESSSHYQLLLTRSLVEMQRLAVAAEDDEATELLSPWTARSGKASAFLICGGRVPLIGDVSPDFPPDWFQNGWPKLWSADPPGSAPAHDAWAAYPDAGWYRWSSGAVDLLWHVNPDGAVGPRSHGHVDLGSFELIWRGQPIVVDPGRPAYAASSSDARKGSSHNTIIVDKCDPMLAWGLNGYPTAMDRRYWDPAASVTRSEDGVVLRHDGFKRLAPGVIVERRFSTIDGRLEIVDTVQQAAGRTIDSFLHLAPEVQVTRRGSSVLRLLAPGVALEAEWTTGDDGAIDVMAGWFSPRYGERVPAPAIRLRVTASGDYRARLTIVERSA